MTNIPFTPPSFHKTSYNCPFCSAYASQGWYELHLFNGVFKLLNEDDTCVCSHCGNHSIWRDGKMIYPNFSGIETPNPDLDQTIQDDYLEAAEIIQRSPRGAAALLRLAVQKLCIQLGGKGEDLNTDIGNLVKKGLPEKVKESLDALRVIGNEAVHPGQLDLKDDVETANALFKLINFTAEKLLTEPKSIDEIYSKLPESKRRQIEKRDVV